MKKKTIKSKGREYEYQRKELRFKLEDGSTKRLEVYGRTKKELDAKVEAAKRLYAIGADNATMTVEQWSERWLSVYVSQKSETQRAHYRAKMKHDVLPAIGNLPIRNVTASRLQELLNSYSGGKFSTVDKIRQAIKQLFSYAAHEGIIDRDPSTKLEMPPTEEEPRRPLTDVERETVLSVSTVHPRGAYVLTMLYCGLRRGECIALTRADVDLDGHRINISKQLSLVKNKGEVTPTKAQKLRRKRAGEDVGTRTVLIPDVLMPVMSKLCKSKKPDDLLFPKTDGKHATRQTVTWWWKSFARACHIEAGARLYRNALLLETSPFGADVTPHYLRHTYATDLLSAGVEEPVRKYLIGHADRDVTATYTAVSPETLDRALILINRYLNSKNTGKNSVKKKKSKP
jgi:integrase